jgi:hypothetical protein
MAGIKRIHRPPVDLASLRPSYRVKEDLHVIVLTPSVSGLSHCLSTDEQEEMVMTACNVDNLSVGLSIGRAEGPAGDNSNRFSLSRHGQPAMPRDPNSRFGASK